ncbi:hypothetical protein ES332_D06G117200v1 [Gossypium tomentosum]|uniref:PB1-like domain-containing protein n=1 Tax=Gossypium tomentosum TaxID=34277 RepID=A0A5D2KJX5_GOSTO|nr:hypothetical protein ES332_D06G117200v1 [Gossypium tomentosum]
MMLSDDEYYIILHVGGHFIKDPYVRYIGGKVIRLKEDPDTISYFELCKIVKIELEFNTVILIYFHEPSTIGLQNNLRVIYNDTSTIAMLDFWVKVMLKGWKLMGRVMMKEVESNGEGDLEKVESGEESEVGEVQADGEGVTATGIEVDEDISMESGGHISLRSTVGEDNDMDNVADEYAGDFATSDRLDNVAAARSGKEEDGNETEVWDSDEHGSLVGSDEDEEHEDGGEGATTIKDHSKMKLKEIQRRCASEMHINVTIDLAVQRVTVDSLPHFKRYYVCFDALKRGWKAGCRPLIGLDGCFLKGPFKSEFLTVVGRDANNRMFLIAWAVVEVECTDS